jgi:hypothetical protein
MKQYTTKEQTQHLIDLGFPTPTNTIEVDGYPLTLLDDYASTTDRFGWVKCYYGYTIGELMEFLPKYNVSILFPVDDIDDDYFVSCSKTDGCGKELIDALYNACVELKNG